MIKYHLAMACTFVLMAACVHAEANLQNSGVKFDYTLFMERTTDYLVSMTLSNMTSDDGCGVGDNRFCVCDVYSTGQGDTFTGMLHMYGHGTYDGFGGLQFTCNTVVRALHCRCS